MPTLLNAQMNDGILIVRLDVPDKSVNSISLAMLDELDEQLDKLEDGIDSPDGVVFTSSKSGSFITGADFYAMRQMDMKQLEQFLDCGQALFERISRLTLPSVAAINGTCLGGGLELALACDYRVAVDSGSIGIALPEIRLGIMPGWGGTTRVPKLIGLDKALPLLLTGKSLTPRQALKLGIVDEVVRAEALLAAARRIVKTRPGKQQPSRAARFILSTSGGRRVVLHFAAKQTSANSYGNYPAAQKVLETVRVGLDNGHDTGLRAERDSLLELSQTEVCHNLMRLFFLRQGAKRVIGQQVQAEPDSVHDAAVVGGGVMGAGITYALIRAGVSVRLVDMDEKAISAALRRIKRMIDVDQRANRISSLEARQLMRQVAPSTRWTGLRRTDLVIEAVPEQMELKRQVFEKLDQLVRPDAVLATNTSSLEVTRISKSTQYPHRVIGLHFFNPVSKMSLVEVVRGEYSTDQALATAIHLALQMGKTPVLVQDAPGFLVNRILFPYLAEALVMACEGQSIREVDQRLREWGMPIGPFQLLDQVGLDVALGMFSSVGDRLDDDLHVPDVYKQVIDRGWLGKKSGTGFYHYPSRGWLGWNFRRPSVHRPLLNILRYHASGQQVDTSDIEMRLILPMVNQMARLLAQRIVPGQQPTDTIDLATVLGLGWAPFRGGLAHWTTSMGLRSIVSQMQELADRYGARFAPTEALRQIAASDQPLEGLVSVTTSGATTTVPPFG